MARSTDSEIRSFSPEQLRRGVERKQRGDGSGDLVFDRKIEYDEGGRRWIDIGFLAIPNVKAVESILRDVLVDDETTVAESDFEETEPVWGEAEEWRFPEETQETGRRRVGCTQILAGMTAVGFVITAMFALFTVNFIHTITDRAAIKQMLDAETLVVEVVPALLAEGEGEPAGMTEMVKADPLVLQTAVRELLPPGWVKAQADATVDAVFDFLETGDPTDAEVAVDVRPVLIRLRSAPGYQAVLAGLRVLPACPEPDPTFDVAGDALEIKDCLPPNAPVAEVARRIHQDVVVAIDESAVLKGEGGVVRVPLLDEETLTPGRREQLERVRRFYWLGRQRAGLLWLIPVGCLSLIVLLAVRSLKRLGYWWGWPLAITGGIGLILALLMPALASSALSSAADATPLAASLSRVAHHFLDALTRLWLRQVAFQAAAMLGFGIALIVLGYTRGTNGGNVL